MNRELEKLVQQYADLYPYQPNTQVTSIPLNTPILNAPILNAPTNPPPERSIDIPVEQRPPILNPVPKDLQLIPARSYNSVPVEVKTIGSSNGILSSLMCGDNLYRMVLIAVIVVCLILYFRKSK